MLFNSIEFLFFFLVFFIIYWFVLGKNLNAQNLFIFFASYVFYGWWDWRFLSLIFFTSLTSYYASIKIEEAKSNRKLILTAVVIINFSLLFFFKYFGFFEDIISKLSTFFNLHYARSAMEIVLPVGISFFTFQSISYVIDVYRSQIKTSRNFVECASFISFFPQLVAGPIERATNLLPQIQKPRIFNALIAEEGLRYILWGLFKKMMVADNCAPVVNDIFAHPTTYNSPMLWVGAMLFAVQIYCDFSGYSEIAIGCGKLLGIQFMTNFSYPYFSRSIKQFWQNWHISLSTWFKDYLYLPLGGSRHNHFITIRNVLIVFGLSGLWHGANYTFIVWGLYHAILYCAFILFFEKMKLRIPKILSIMFTLVCVTIGWVFFRSNDIFHAKLYLIKMFTFSDNYKVSFDPKVILGIFILFSFEIWNRKRRFGLDINTVVESRLLRWLIYSMLILIWMTYANFNELTFIYFNF